VELVADQETKAPLCEEMVQAVIAECMANSAVIISGTNRSLTGLNNTLCLSPAFIVTRPDIDAIVSAIDSALTRIEAG